MFCGNPSLPAGRAALWFLGQSGFFLQGGTKTVLIDPYLSDSAGQDNALFTRLYPPPLPPGQVRADFYVVTHDHLDHLDPETLAAYAHKRETHFIAPRFAARRLRALGAERVTVVDHGDVVTVDDVRIEGVFALATGSDVLDTTGYHITLPGGKSVYHSSDTADCELLYTACKHAQVALVCINGKFGNLTAAQAARLCGAVNAEIAVPHHYDTMALNSENPEAFRYFLSTAAPGIRCEICKPMEELQW